VGPGSARSRRTIGTALAVALVATACGTSPTATPSSATLPTQTVQPTGSPAIAEAIHVALPSGGEGNYQFGPLTNATSAVGDDYEKAGLINVFIYDALYRYDETLKPVPSLARECDPSADGLTVTCTLADTRFQNGDPVTADDVVFTYELMAANTHVESDFTRDCVTGLNAGSTGCLADVLSSVSKVDDRTVVFHLRSIFTPFFTSVLPAIWIDSQKVIRASYERLRSKLTLTSPADLTAEATRVQKETEAQSGNCAPLLQEAAQMAARAGLFVPDRSEYSYLPNGEFDACGYAGALSAALFQGAASLTATDETTAIAMVYPDLDVDRAPVGAGPYKLTSYIPNKKVVVESWTGYHGGTPATKQFVFDIYPDDDATAKAVARGDAAWLEDYYNADAFRQLKDLPSLRFGHPANPVYGLIAYNVRAGQLFSDLRLRQAVEDCVDKPSITSSATEGRGIPAYADVMPGLWAYDPQIPQPPRDVAAGKKLIEDAGWALGGDGIYVKAGHKLAATIYVRHDAPDRFKFTQLVSLQARECGMDLQPTAGDFGGGLRSILSWPNHGPDSDRPFDLYFLLECSCGWDPLEGIFDSAEVTSAAKPDGANFGGFSDPRVDDLLGRIKGTYDLQARADLFRQYQERLAKEQPAYFAWFQARLDAASAGLKNVHGPIDLDLPHWFAFPERLVLETSGGS